MKKLLLTIACASILTSASVWAAAETTTPESATEVTSAATPATTATTAASSQTDTNNLSYAMGFKTGQAMKTRTITINTSEFSQGLQDGYSGVQPRVSDQVMQTALTNMQQEMMKKMQAQYAEVAAKNQKEGADFLDKNEKLPGVVTLPSGLEYKIIDAGKGDAPTATDTVTVNYEGNLINGTVFDSSYKRGKPAIFKVNQVIKGWQEALQLMKPGATWMLYIPSNLAYGSQGSMGDIGPNETLIFKVHLISVQKS